MGAAPGDRLALLAAEGADFLAKAADHAFGVIVLDVADVVQVRCWPTYSDRYSTVQTPELDVKGSAGAHHTRERPPHARRLGQQQFQSGQRQAESAYLQDSESGAHALLGPTPAFLTAPVQQNLFRVLVPSGLAVVNCVGPAAHVDTTASLLSRCVAADFPTLMQCIRNARLLQMVMARAHGRPPEASKAEGTCAGMPKSSRSTPTQAPCFTLCPRARSGRSENGDRPRSSGSRPVSRAGRTSLMHA